MAGISSPAINISEFPSNLNVLAIDTDLRVFEFINKSCKEDSHQVIICTESSSAVDVLLKKEIDIHLIIMELHMPMMDGYEFLQFLNKEVIDIPFAVMSEDYSSISMTKAFDLGACDYFKKPFNDDYWLNLWGSMFKHHIYLRRKKKNIDSLDDDEIMGKSDNSVCF
ncbi:hypothetical protein V8G54_001707 [Vigna mungo]|uniref:Response regulatory domain-containing protein n=1 Tax=Vigna mungo TaxID=3915 RepID=A0AAQ3SB69_VIGMU